MTEKKKVPVFNCEVRHGGNVMQSLVKKGVTDREIRVLRHIHGPDGVVNVNQSGEAEIDQVGELYDLASRYAVSFTEPQSGKVIVERALNVSIRGFDEWLMAQEESKESARQEQRAQAQKDAAKFQRARDAAEAQVRAELAREQARA